MPTLDGKPWGEKPPEGKITEHFSWVEARCRCGCGQVASLLQTRLTAQWLENVREEVFGGRPMHVNSWNRCPQHNRNVGGATQSEHMTSRAVDVTVRGLTPYQAWLKAKQFQGLGKLIGGLGRYASFVHLDRGKPRRWNGP